MNRREFAFHSFRPPHRLGRCLSRIWCGHGLSSRECSLGTSILSFLVILWTQAGSNLPSVVPTPKEWGHRGLREGECRHLSFVVSAGEMCVSMGETVASFSHPLGTPWHPSCVVSGRRWLGWLFLVSVRVLLHSRTEGKY